MSITLTALQEEFAAIGIAPIRRVYTSAGMPIAVQARDLPVLMPDPAQPLASSQSSRMTMGGAGWRRDRVLNYVCLVAEAGTGRNPADHAEKLANCIDAVENAFCDAMPDGVHGLPLVSIGGAGLLTDPSGKQFHGFTVQVSVTTSY